jgi:hypothetical protein
VLLYPLRGKGDEMRYLSPDKVERFIAYLNSEIDYRLKERGEHVMASKSELATHTKIRVNQTEIIKSVFMQFLTEDEE